MIKILLFNYCFNLQLLAKPELITCQRNKNNISIEANCRDGWKSEDVEGASCNNKTVAIIILSLILAAHYIIGIPFAFRRSIREYYEMKVKKSTWNANYNKGTAIENVYDDKHYYEIPHRQPIAEYVECS